MSTRRLFPAVLLIVAACGGPARDPQSSAPDADPVGETATTGERPDIIVIVVDDLRFDEFGAAGHPYLETPNIDRLAREGALFTNSFHAVPLCSPNRASILTGQYPTRHGIIDNVARNIASHGLRTFPQDLHVSGYETAFLGKWHMGNDPTPRPGFDYWVGMPGQGRTHDPELFEDGQLHVVSGYVTDILTDRAIAFIERDRATPYMIYIGHKAVHPDVRQLDDGSVDTRSSLGYLPADRHVGRYEDEVFERRPNTMALPDPGKPALRHALEYRASDEITDQFSGILDVGTSETTIRRRAEMLLAVDEGLGRIIETLEARGTLDRTMIVFTSDNGFFFGEHGLSLERRMPYEESIRNPLIIRYPPLATAGSRPSSLAVSVDIAPTVLDVAGTPIGDHVQGRSLVPLLREDISNWRDGVLIEFYTYENPMPWLVDMDYRALRTARYKYIRWLKYPAMDELYDLETDPFEMVNRIDDPDLADVRDDLRARLGRHILEAMDLAASRPVN